MNRNRALEYAQGRRVFRPALYNEKRLKEYSSDVEHRKMREPRVVDSSASRLNELSEIIIRLNAELGDEDLTIDTDGDDNELFACATDAHNDIATNEGPSIDVDIVAPAGEIESIADQSIVINDPFSGNHLFTLNVR